MKEYTFQDIQLFYRDHVGACSRSGVHPMRFSLFVEVHWPEFTEEYRRFELAEKEEYRRFKEAS